MSQQAQTVLRKAKVKSETRSPPSFETLARQYFDLQRLRQAVRIAECGKMALHESALTDKGAVTDWSPADGPFSANITSRH